MFVCIVVVDAVKQIPLSHPDRWNNELADASFGYLCLHAANNWIELKVITPWSGWGPVMPLLFPLGYLSQSSGFRLAKQIYIRRVFRYTGLGSSLICTLRGGRTTAGVMPLGLFLLTGVLLKSNWIKLLYLLTEKLLHEICLVNSTLHVSYRCL